MSSGIAFQKRPHDSVTAEPQPSVNAAERERKSGTSFLAVIRRDLGTPSGSTKSNAYHADRRRDPSPKHRLDAYLKSHLIDPSLLRTDNFDDFMKDRQKQLLSLIEQATSKAAYAGSVPEEGEDVEEDEDAAEADLTIAA